MLCVLEYLHSTISITYYDVAGIDHMCSGGDHMKWGYIRTNSNHDHLHYFAYLQWFILMELGWLVRPLWILFPVMVYGFVSIIFLCSYFDFSGEWGPMWCWAIFASALWFLAVPWVCDRIEKDLEESGSKWKWLFQGTEALQSKKGKDDVEAEICALHAQMGTV